MTVCACLRAAFVHVCMQHLCMFVRRSFFENFSKMPKSSLSVSCFLLYTGMGIKVAKKFDCRGLPDLLTQELGSKWQKSSIVEVSASKKLGFIINAILKSQVAGLHLFH